MKNTVLKCKNEKLNGFEDRKSKENMKICIVCGFYINFYIKIFILKMIKHVNQQPTSFNASNDKALPN